MTFFSSDHHPSSRAMYRLLALGLFIFAGFIGPALGQLTGPASTVSVSGCPAVVSTAHVCETCMTMDCVVPATITAGCGSCGTSAPTVYRTFPCSQGCPTNIGCKTVYSVVTASNSNACDAASSAPPELTTSLPTPDVDTSTDDRVGTNSASASSVSRTRATAASTSITSTPGGSPNQNAPATVTSTAGAARLMGPRLW